MNNKFVTIAFS